MRTMFPLLAAAAVALSGCASVMKGSTQSIAVTTPPTTGATCELSNGVGNWTLISPGSVKVDKSKRDMQVRCSKPGWQDGVATIPSNFQGWTVGNLVLGGLVGVGVDAATGAINEYPHTFQVPMAPVATAQAPSQPPPIELQRPTEVQPASGAQQASEPGQRSLPQQ